jgi:hypothetical protein
MNPDISEIVDRSHAVLRAIHAGAVVAPATIEQILHHDLTALIARIRYLERISVPAPIGDHA